MLLKNTCRNKRKKVTPFPEQMVRRQHTPKELENILNKVGLQLKYVIYYHAHPFTPRFKETMPQLFNHLGFLMQPLGYTSIGSNICSSFVAVVQKA